MTFKPAIWRPIALALGALNLAGMGFAVAGAEPWHATLHAGLAAAFGLWAQRLGKPSAPTELQPQLEALETEVMTLRQELTEAQERLDFAERLLTREPETRRMGPER